MQEDIE